MVGPLWNINRTWVLVFAIYICGISCGIWSTKMLQKHIYIYEEYRVEYHFLSISQKHINIYIYEEHRVEYPNCTWHFEESPKNNSTKSHIYMKNIVWNIMCLPRASRNQAKTSSLGIALWNICGISKSVLLRAFEALGAFRSSFDRAILEAGLCSYSRSVSGRRGCGITAA